METAGENSDLVGQNLIDDAMFLIDSSRSAAGVFMFERLGFAHAVERIAFNVENQINDAERFFAILFDPPRQIFKRVYVKFQASLGHLRT